MKAYNNSSKRGIKNPSPRVSIYGTKFFSRWWMCCLNEYDEFAGFVTTAVFPYDGSKELKKQIKKLLVKKGKKLGYKTVGVVNHG